MKCRKSWIALAVTAVCLTGCGSRAEMTELTISEPKVEESAVIEPKAEEPGAKEAEAKQPAVSKRNKVFEEKNVYQNVYELFEKGTVANVYNRTDYRNDLVKTIDGDYSKFKIRNEKDALRSFEQIKKLVGMKDPAKELVFERTMDGPSDGDTIYDFNQYYEGIPVYDGSVRLIVKSDGRPDWFTGNFVPEIELDSVKPAISEQEMVTLIEKMENIKKVYDDMSLCIIENEETDHKPTLAYIVTVDKVTGVWNDPDRKIVLDFLYIVSADTGELLFSNPLTIID